MTSSINATSEAESNSISREKKLRGSIDAEKQQFGQVALDLGFITRKQLKEALALQRKIKEKRDSSVRLGDILLKRSYITEKQQKKVFQVQGLRGGHTEIEGYTLLDKIGTGSMGTVYEAHQESMERKVAIKILAPALAIKKDYQRRFISEARTVAQLNHPYIVRGIDVGKSKGIYYFVMEFVDGPTIEQVLDRGGAMVHQRALHYVTQIAEALKHARKKKLVHRDIKPDNIMVNSEGNAKLCDLGVARVLSGEEQDSRGFGTPNYMAPEQVENRSDVSIQADIYSLGATFFHMLTGRVPFPGDNAEIVMQKHLNDPVPKPSDLESSIPGDIDQIVRKMMEKNLHDRYSTPSDLLKDLESVEQDTTDDDGNKDGPSRRIRRRRFRR